MIQLMRKSNMNNLFMIFEFDIRAKPVNFIFFSFNFLHSSFVVFFLHSSFALDLLAVVLHCFLLVFIVYVSPPSLMQQASACSTSKSSNYQINLLCSSQ